MTGGQNHIHILGHRCNESARCSPSEWPLQWAWFQVNEGGISIKYHRPQVTWHVPLNAHLLMVMETRLESMKLCVCLFLWRDGAHRGCSLCAKWTFGWWQLSTLSLSLQWAVLDSNTKNTPWVDGNSSISDVCGYLVANYFQQLLEM